MLAALKTRTLYEQLTSILFQLDYQNFETEMLKESFTSVIIGSKVHIRLVRTHTSLRGQVYTLIICSRRLGVHNPTAVRNYTVKMLDLTMQKLLWFLAFMNRAF